VKVTRPARKRAPAYNASLSAREAGILASWERERRVIVVLRDLRHLAGHANATHVASRMVKKRVLERVGPGRYLVRPLRTQGRPTAASAQVIAAALLQDEAFYLGGLWALTFHRLSDQQYVSDLDVFVAKRHPARAVGSARLHFHRVPLKQLAYGTAEAEIEGVRVQVSSPERTLLDLLDLPALAGGAGEALRRVREALPLVSVPLLVEHAARGSKASTCQRLGFLLERAGVPPRKLLPLVKRISETKSLLSLYAGAPRKGPIDRRWRVVENDS
jgi:predicted transcriptional regulator of viral defense system